MGKNNAENGLKQAAKRIRITHLMSKNNAENGLKQAAKRVRTTHRMDKIKLKMA